MTYDAHADNLGVDGRGDAVVHLAVELGEHVGCWEKEMGMWWVSASVLDGRGGIRDGVKRRAFDRDVDTGRSRE